MTRSGLEHAGPRPGLRGRVDAAEAWFRARPRLRRRIAAACAVTAALLVLIHMGSSWWSAPRAGTVAELEADLAARAVTSAQRASASSGIGTPRHRDPLSIAEDERYASLLAWTTSSQRVRFVAADDAVTPQDPSDASMTTGARPRTEALEGRLAAAGVPSRLAPGLAQQMPWTGTAVYLLLLGGLLAAAPRRGTRFFWFMFALSSPGQVGVLAWLASERPWRPGAGPDPARPPEGTPPPRARRWSGLAGWALGVVASLLLLGLLVPARALFGPGLVPH